jgi:hypothetical protein
MLAQMAELAAEVICRTLFGRRLGAGAAREVVEAFARYQAGVPQIDPLSLFGLPDWVPRPARGGCGRRCCASTPWWTG